MESTAKQRNSSQCREWERQRRNKFNDAITKLGEIVKAICNASNSLDKDTDKKKVDDNVKYPKIEIVQKAIICLNKSAQEKTHLKAEILALQVKLENIKTSNRKDAATQVYLDKNKKNKCGKYVKLIAKKKSNIQENKLRTESVIVNNENKSEQQNNKIKTKVNERTKPVSKLPILLPRCNVFDKKAPDNAIFVLPATPYIFPPRPFVLPSMSPAIVVVDTNLQAFNKVPVVSRNGGDITKTTMVNILPISAYSRPLSATKQKKSNVRLKSDSKNTSKKIKLAGKNVKAHIQNKENPKTKSHEEETKENKVGKLAKDHTIDKINEIVPVTTSQSLKSSIVLLTSEEKVTINKDSPSTDKSEVVDSSKPKICEVPITTETTVVTKPNTDINVTPKSVATTITTTAEAKNSSQNDEVNKTSSKINLENEITPVDKAKENKLSNILDTTLDNVVDGGNARLELAEEFLAASPTAAFLMSFPLVSGNRADSPADETQNTALSNTKDLTQKRNDNNILPQESSTPATFFEKTNSDIKIKVSKAVVSSTANKQNEQPKYISNTVVAKPTEPKISSAVSVCNVSNENPFLSLPMPTLISTTCPLSDTTFGLDFESNLIKPTTSQPASYTSNSNIFYKNDPFSTVKSTIYSTSSISSNHEFNGIGLYPCAMEKYAPKNKSDFASVDENNVMKIGSSRLTYDIDLGWSHKSFDFVSCTSNTTFGKDNLTTVTSSTPFCTSYNPFNPEFHVPLVSTSSKKDSVANKTNSSFADTLTSFYSQHNLWTEEPFYNNTNVTKNLSTKHQNYPVIDNLQGVSNVKPNIPKQYEIKSNLETNVDNRMKSTNNIMSHQVSEKYTKKSPSKMHINWMTSEIRPNQTAYNPTHTEMKDPHKITYNHLDHTSKRNDQSETNFFPIPMHNFPSQTVQEEFQVWPSARPLGTTEISIDPPPINLPTLVGDLALGPHDKKKTLDPTTRPIPQQELQNCSNFFSVTQLMNRSSENASSRYQSTQIESSKPIVTKHNISHYPNDSHRKSMAPRIENHTHQPYIFNNPKSTHSYDNMAQFSQNKPKTANKSDKNTKVQKNNYSAESLLRGGTFNQKIPDNSSKFLMPPQKYNDFNTPQDSSVAQVSHFPPIIDYSENSYTGQQFSGTSLYNATTNTLSNSFYSNFMPGSSNLMSSNYTSGPFAGEFIDYNQSSECNFTNHKYEELKMRNNPPIFQAEKAQNYKSSRRESAAKHKLDCSKKDSSKKYQNKRAKPNADVEEWSESHPLWQNKPPNKRHPNLMTEELPFPNYVSNQMHSQYQPEFFNSHLMPSNMQAVGPNVDRSLSSNPITSRANFNLSTIFPEITMKVQ